MNSVKIMFGIAIAALVGFFFVSVGFTTSVNGTEEIVFVKRPYFFGEKGVSMEPLSKGRAIVAPSTSQYRFTMTPLRKDEPFRDLMTKDKVMVDFTASIVLQIERGESPVLYKGFGMNWYTNNVQNMFVEMVRSFAKETNGNDLISSSTSVSEAQQTIKAEMQKYLNDSGIPVTVKTITIGKATPNKALLEEIDRTSAQRQRVTTEIERRKAEESRKAAEEAKAEADKAYLTKFGMTTEEYLQLRSLEIEKEKIELVKEKNNVQILMMSGGNGFPGVMPTYDVKRKH